MSYKLEIYGGKNIERSTETFDRLSEAVESVEMVCTDDNRGWEMGGDSLSLVDDNNSDRKEDIVIHKITRTDN